MPFPRHSRAQLALAKAGGQPSSPSGAGIHPLAPHPYPCYTPVYGDSVIPGARAPELPYKVRLFAAVEV